MIRNSAVPKIVIVGPSTRFLSGISYYTIRLANTLSAHTSVTALLFRHMIPKKLFPGSERVGKDLATLSYLPTVHIREILDWYNPVTWIRGLQQLKKADVIILEWWTSSVAHMYFALVILLQGKKKYFIEFHEIVDPLEYAIAPLRIYAMITGRIIRKQAKGYIVHSDHDRNGIAQHYAISKDRITIIPHGLYDQYPTYEKTVMREKLGICEPYILLFFGLIRQYKGVSYLIEAFENLPESVRNTMHLLIVGEVWDEPNLYIHLEESVTAEHITLINRYVSDDEIPIFFSAADALVLPYTRASQSGIAHIGISYGLPIIASEVGGLQESLAIYDGTTFVKPEDSDSLTRAIISARYKKPKQYKAPKSMQWETIREKWMEILL